MPQAVQTGQSAAQRVFHEFEGTGNLSSEKQAFYAVAGNYGIEGRRQEGRRFREAFLRRPVPCRRKRSHLLHRICLSSERSEYGQDSPFGDIVLEYSVAAGQAKNAHARRTHVIAYDFPVQTHREAKAGAERNQGDPGIAAAVPEAHFSGKHTVHIVGVAQFHAVRDPGQDAEVLALHTSILVLHTEYTLHIVEGSGDCQGYAVAEFGMRKGFRTKSGDGLPERGGNLLPAAVGVYRYHPSVGALYESAADVQQKQSISGHSDSLHAGRSCEPSPVPCPGFR